MRIGISALVEAKGININAVDHNKNTPLHLAAEKGYVEIVNTLLGKGADVNVKNGKEETPLYLAVEYSHVDVVKALIKEGADVNIADKDGNTPLGLTTKEEIKTLLKNAEKSDNGESSTDNEGDQEEDAGKERQEGDVHPDEENLEEGSQRGQGISAKEGTDLKTEVVGSVASAESAQTEEQPSSFFGSLFSILTNPFSLIASFFSGIFYGYLALTEKTLMNLTHNLMFLCLRRVHWTMIFTIQRIWICRIVQESKRKIQKL